MTQEEENRYRDFPVFKGLQKPLEFLGLQGRYIYWAVGTVGASIVGFIICYCLFGFLAGLAVLLVCVTGGSALILSKQRKGLHSKKEAKGIYVYAYSKKL